MSAGGLLVRLSAALILAGVMMVVYRLCHDSLSYSRKFNVTLMMLTLSSTVLLVLIQSKPVYSLGALGALSICRIRTNTRDPRDLGFVFWSLSIGISAALGSFAVGMAGTAVMGLVMLTLGRADRKRAALTMVVRGRKEKIGDVQAVFSGLSGSTVQSKNVFSDSFELVYRLSVPREEEEKLLLLFNDMEGVDGVNVLAPQTQVA
ncbi:DUF4956 domain-containing protein [Oscillibacter sp. MSJ-2]|uniref:DUF4956 domain-containing protein n=2 Tax=Dysosmobacter acutus TaxID=2841504 RepID=A0ABS6F8Z6_9FIRM|nr:DUF4956 domain-containing protein [Dysosmobacter acutus]